MSWQRSLQTAVRALKREEEALVQRLDTLRSKIDDLESMAKENLPTVRKGAVAKRRLSPEGRAAISKAAKKRWQKYRADKVRQTRRRS